MKHDWYLNSYNDGIDCFRYDQGFHNVPECRRCGWIGCEHCEFDRNIYDEECPSNQLDMPFEDVVE